MQVDHCSFQDNKRATTAVENGCESRSAQSGSEDAPVYCEFIVTLFLFHSSNYFQFIVSSFKLFSVYSELHFKLFPVYCQLLQIISTKSSLRNSNISIILHILQVQDVEAVLCDEAAVLGKISLKDIFEI